MLMGNGWYREKWATPYMAAMAERAFRPRVGLAPLIHPRIGLAEPDVTLTPQLAPQKIIERLGPGGTMPLPDVTLTPQLAPEKITTLGAAPELGEWFKENRILVVAVIVALVLLFFFLKKRRR